MWRRLTTWTDSNFCCMFILAFSLQSTSMAWFELQHIFVMNGWFYVTKIFQAFSQSDDRWRYSSNNPESSAFAASKDFLVSKFKENVQHNLHFALLFYHWYLLFNKCCLSSSSYLLIVQFSWEIVILLGLSYSCRNSTWNTCRNCFISISRTWPIFGK